MSIAKLKVGPLRRGRGNETDETRQIHDESLARDELLRGAIVELCATVKALEKTLEENVGYLEGRIDFLEDLHP